MYACNEETFYDRFDIVHFPGVLYHLSDPLIALRILFNSLKPGGIILVETAGIDDEEPVCRFEGSRIHLGGTKEELDRTGWNWFLPSLSALERMMREAGFEEVSAVLRQGSSRIYGYGKKLFQVGICRAGLSAPDIR
jgi:SAM-dependent methyltransferase